jgi:hypothetical protein
MAHRKVREVMTAGLVTGTPGTPFKELAAIMAAHDVGALPVLDDEGRAAGAVAEIDLLPRAIIIVVGRSAETGAIYRVEAPDRVLRMFAMLTAVRDELDLGTVPPEGQARIHGLLAIVRSELERSVSPALAGELRDLVRLGDAVPGTAELRVEYASLLGWTSGLVVAMFDQLATGLADAQRPPFEGGTALTPTGHGRTPNTAPRYPRLGPASSTGGSSRGFFRP